MIALIISIVIAQAAGAIGSIFTISSISTWYAGLIKPAFSPPNWLFGPTWFLLYTLMGIAAYLIWRKRQEKRIGPALWLYGVHLVLNALWSIIFFGLKNPGIAFVEIIFFWLAILTLIIIFSKVSRPAALLLLPYIAWVSFAAYLNLGIWQLNKISETGKENLIRVTVPRLNQMIASPLVVRGEARGNWFFEATFPVILTDWDGRIIAQSYAQAEGEWMTENFVPFEGKIEFENPENIGEFSRRGALIFKKDNPSGLPQYDDALEIPVRFRD